MIPIRRAPRTRFLALVALALSSLSSPALGGRGSVDVEHFRPMVDGRGLFAAESADLLAPFELAFGFSLHYSKNPLVFSLDGHKRGDLVNDRLSGDALFALGLFPWLQAGLALPVAFANAQNAGLGGSSEVTGFGSARLVLKARLLDELRHGVGLAFLFELRLPTGNPNVFLGQNGVVAAPALAVERAFGPARMVANLGVALRPEAPFLDLSVGHELFYRLGFGVRVGERAELGAELSGSTALSSPFGADERLNPLELLIGARLFLSERWQLAVGAGPGLSRGYGAPTMRGFAAFAFAPRERDSDGDGIPDREDACPLERGVARLRGCPEKDSDGDGVPDDLDACPKVRGPKANKGCPWPDSDGDGVPDKDDKCPRIPGPKENKGCPWPDSDGDGVLDKDDKCPFVKGPKENHGCPWADSDGDGVLDKDDKCPFVKGPKENQGCPWPDRDGDGVPDKDDRCPDVPGPAKNKGCPWPDTDGDGVTDNEDDCPTEPGPKWNRGCPVR